MNKLVIANSAKGSYGKSAALNAVCDLFEESGHERLMGIRGADSKVVYDVDGVKVGIETMGDPNSRMFSSLDDFVKMECEIIIVACRSKGDTRKKVESLRHNDYDVIFSASYNYNGHDEKKIRPMLNRRYAEVVYDFVMRRINGEF